MPLRYFRRRFLLIARYSMLTLYAFAFCCRRCRHAAADAMRCRHAAACAIYAPCCCFSLPLILFASAADLFSSPPSFSPAILPPLTLICWRLRCFDALMLSFAAADVIIFVCFIDAARRPPFRRPGRRCATPLPPLFAPLRCRFATLRRRFR